MSAIRKSEFAKLCNVSAPCVSQWISGGKIDGAAIVGEGRSALIDPAIALKQLKERLATNERCGLNGLGTNLDWWPPAEEAPRAPDQAVHTPPPAGTTRPRPAPPPDDDDDEEPGSLDARLKAQKLEQNEILTRKLRTEERARDGIYMDAAGARGTMVRIASEMMKIFEGALPDFASAQAAKFQISQRESLHQLRLTSARSASSSRRYTLRLSSPRQRPSRRLNDRPGQPGLRVPSGDGGDPDPAASGRLRAVGDQKRQLL